MEKPPHDVDAVFDINEIAHLPAVFVFFFIRFEKFDLAGFFDLMKGLENDAGHIAFVVFVGAEDIEKFDSSHSAFELLAQYPQIEYLFGITVHIDGFESGDGFVAVCKSFCAVAIGCRGTGIDKTNIVVQRPFGQNLGIRVIVVP